MGGKGGGDGRAGEGRGRRRWERSRGGGKCAEVRSKERVRKPGTKLKTDTHTYKAADSNTYVHLCYMKNHFHKHYI